MLIVRVGVTRPLARLATALEAMSAGQVDTDILEAGRTDEIGAIGKAVAGIRTLVSRRAVEQAEVGRAAAAAERGRTLLQPAEGFEGTVGRIIGLVTAPVAALRDAARTMADTAGRATDRSADGASAAGEAARTVGAVAGAAEQLGASVRQIGGSASLAQAAGAEADRTAFLVEDLGAAAAIAAAVEQQGAATRAIVRGVAQASAGTRAITATLAEVADEVLASAPALARQSAALDGEVRRFLATLRAA